MSDRVVVVVPGAEGGWIVRAFARESVDAIRAEADDGVPPGAVLVIDREVKTLSRWLADFGGDAILVGWDPPTDDERAALDVAAFYPRPVNLSGLIRRVQTLLEGAALPATPRADSSPPSSGVHSPAVTLAPPSEPTADATLHDSTPPIAPEPPATVGGSDVPSGPPARPTLGAPPEPDRTPDLPLYPEGELPPREPTIRLTADDEAEAHAAAAAAAGRATQGEASLPQASEDDDGEPSIERVHLSPRIAKLLSDADRRLFPNEPALELSFPAGDEPPDALVPDELLAESGTPLEPREADPLEAFTFVGTPDLLDTASGSLSSVREDEGSFELTPHTVVERASRPPPAGQSERPSSTRASEPPSTTGSVDITRAGTVPAGGALRMVFELVQRRRPCRVLLEVAGGPDVEIHFEGEAVLGVRGPRAQRALAELVRAGRLPDPLPAAADRDREAVAAEALDEAVNEGRIAAFERDRALRLAAHALIGDALIAHEARYTVNAAESGSREASPVSGTLTSVAVEEARRRLDAATVLGWLSISRRHGLALERSFASRARDLGLEPEVAALFLRAAGRPLAELLDAPPLAGVPGALFAVASADLVRLEAPPKAEVEAAPNADALAEAIERAHAIATEGSYQAILGVSPRASARELESARRECLAAMQGDLERVGLERLAPARALAVDAIEEAYEVLTHPRWRQLYAPR
ncbi:MAG: hypothetical protein JJ863_11750 [Deltaproteobacteria bacterium]|nr:hypothetical protein [Deltaproteobacteria bacterium]